MAAQPVHIDISQEINGWANAQIGRDVRKYNVSALAKLQDQTNTAVDYVVEKGEAIDQAAKDVQTVRQEAQGAVDHANDITAEYKQYADDKLAATEQERQAAQTARTGSEAAATLAESWAVGGTGSRPGEDGSNSQFWAEKSQESAGQASREADRAAQYASIVAPGFLVDPGSMELYMKAGVGVDFIVTDDAELCWKIA
ncbi:MULTISPECIES: hypothetical protein [Enterocloster]|jgi:hypothetical protein|uniref:hypothetical protein n=1 Tax=Enterocloster TaxID=2719313 RepID=UPI000D19F646|nr:MULTISPECIES: hypothetical protein [Enterocloster]DAH06762.1 MAG TPA: hypothetical protein [Caudoviricetes sp.]